MSTFDAEQLMARGREISGIDRIDEGAITALSVLVDSINSDSKLHEGGVIGMRNKLERVLANRLRMQRDFAEHPEIHDQTIEAPIVIIGMPRTGSTKSQKILCSSGDFNWLAMWQSSYPSLITGSRDESVQPRIDGGLEYEAWIEQASPDIKACHQFLAMEPEEDSWVLEHSLVSPVFLGFSRVEGYVAWIVKQDIRVQFEFLRDTLKYLQWQGVADPAKRWILKCPMYYGLEPVLLETFPDAALLMTHRSPVSALPSGARMLELFHLLFSHQPPDIAGLYAGARSGQRRHMRNRAADPNMKILDIHYLDVVDDPATLIQRVYDFVGTPLSQQSLQRMLDWNQSNPKDARGKHLYSLEQYGFSESEINVDFADYLTFMESAVGRH